MSVLFSHQQSSFLDSRRLLLYCYLNSQASPTHQLSISFTSASHVSSIRLIVIYYELPCWNYFLFSCLRAPYLLVWNSKQPWSILVRSFIYFRLIISIPPFISLQRTSLPKLTNIWFSKISFLDSLPFPLGACPVSLWSCPAFSCSFLYVISRPSDLCIPDSKLHALIARIRLFLCFSHFLECVQLFFFFSSLPELAVQKFLLNILGWCPKRLCYMYSTLHIRQFGIILSLYVIVHRSYLISLFHTRIPYIL